MEVHFPDKYRYSKWHKGKSGFTSAANWNIIGLNGFFFSINGDLSIKNRDFTVKSRGEMEY